jgi:hypothetical protein
MSTMEALNFACEDCSEVFSSRNKLFSHIRQSHDEAARSRELTNIRTSDASTEFTAEALYSRIVIASEDDLWYSVAIKPQVKYILQVNPFQRYSYDVYHCSRHRA